jgi:photosystem II stability/assembly factor-like uncharacterized protein
MKASCTIQLKISMIFIFCYLNVSGLCQWQKLEEPYGGYIYNIAQVDNLLFAGSYFLCVSDDYGISWEKVEAFPEIPVRILLGYDGCLLACTFTGIYRSMDHGLNWEKLDPPVNGQYIKLLCRTKNTLVAYVENSGTSSVIYLSEDNGDSWSIPETPFNSDYINSIQSIHDVLYACSINEIYRSTDSGHHWEVFTSKVQNCNTLTYANNQFIAINMFSCWRSDDGVTWDTVVNNFFKPYNILALDSVGFKSQRLLLGVSNSGWEGGNPGGLFYSDDNGSNWFPVEEVNNADHWEISNEGISYREFNKVSADGNIIFVTGRNEIEQFLSTDYGKSWLFQRLPEISGDPSLNSILIANNRLWIATREGLYYKNVSDSSWNVKMQDSSFLFLSEANQVIYAATRRSLFKTTDNGESWTICNNTAGLPWIMGLSAKENTVVVLLHDSVMYSNDFGEHFYSSELPVFWNQDILLTNDGKDFFIACQSSGMFLSIDNGANWQKVNDSTFSFLNGIAAGPGCIFLSTRDGGVIRSTDKGYTWKRFNEGFPKCQNSVNGLALSADTLFAVGQSNYLTGMGINKRSSFHIGIPSQEKNVTELRIHPNPVVGSFTISFQDQTLSHVPFSIISNNGKNQVNGYSGTNGKISIEYLPSGTYVIEIYHQERWYAAPFIKM